MRNCYLDSLRILVVLALVCGVSFRRFAEAQQPCPSGNLLTEAVISSQVDIYEPNLINDNTLNIDGTDWSSGDAAVFESKRSFVIFDLGTTRELTGFALQGDNNDRFYVEVSLDGVRWSGVWAVPTVSKEGLQVREMSGPPSAARFVRLSASAGDDFVSVSELAAFCQKPERWRASFSTVSGSPRIASVERRQGAGATFWLWLWGGLLALATVIVATRLLSRETRADSRWLADVRRYLTNTYLTLDRRTLALFRISIGILLFGDLLVWILNFDLILSTAGLLSPRHLVLGDDPFTSFTLLRWSPNDWSTWTLIAIAALSYGAFTVGYCTRSAQILTWLCALSLHNAAPMLNNSGHMVMRLLLTWTLLLPLGDRFSLDSVRRTSHPQTGQPDRFTSVFALILTIQLCAIYLFNVLHKFDDTWLDGSFLSLIMQDPSITTAFGVRVAEFAPAWVLSMVTVMTLAIEAAGPFLLLSPIYPRHCRAIAIVTLIILHLGIALMMKLAVFSSAMTCFLILMLPGAAAQRIVECFERLVRRVPVKSAPAEPNIIASERGDTRTWDSLGRAAATTVFVTLFGVASLSQLIRENEPLSSWFKHRPIQPLQRILTALNTYQGWCMFATCGNRSFPATRATLVIEAIDARGVRIDLMRSIVAGTRVAPPVDLMTPPTEPTSDLWRIYDRRIMERNPAILRGLIRYLRSSGYTQFSMTAPIELESYVRHQPLRAPAIGRLPLVIRRDAPDLAKQLDVG